jgi:anti-sigma factor RsiW
VLFRRRRSLVCRQAVELMTDYLEDTLPPRDRARLEEHLVECPHCTEYLAQIRDLVAAAGHVEPDDLPQGTVDGLVALYRTWRTDS